MTAFIIGMAVGIFLLILAAYIKWRYQPFLDEIYENDGSRRLVVWYTKYHPEYTERDYITIFKVA